jgi:methionyl-tRNA formyltransferase
MEKIKIILMGTPNFASYIFEAIIKAGYDVSLIVSQPDKEVGRKKILTPTPTKLIGEKYGIEVFQPVKIRNDFEIIKKLNPDLIITCAYGQILPNALLEIPQLGCINIHGSLLPKLRGGAPIHHAIIDGYKETGITIMEMIAKMDAGAMFVQKATPISDTDTLDTLHDRLMEIGKDLILEFLPKYIKGDYIKTEQKEEEVTYGYNIKREEERIKWDNNYVDVFNLIRGLNSTPGAYTTLDGQNVKIFDVRKGTNKVCAEVGKIVSLNGAIEVQCKDGTILIDSLQFAGKNKVKSSDYLRGNSKYLVEKQFI